MTSQGESQEPSTDGGRPPRPAASMAGQAMRGVSWSFVGAAGQFLLHLVSIVVLSRLLSVADFGAAVAASVVIGLAVMVGQQGIGPALVQARRLDRDDVVTAFYLASGLGVLLAAVLLLAAPLLSRAVGLGDHPEYLRLLSLVLVLGGLGAVSVGLLQRQLRFRDLALAELGSYAIGYLGVSVPLALLGFGTVSLIWAQIAQVALQVLMTYALVRHDIRPRRVSVMAARSRHLVRFSSAYSLSLGGNWLATNGDNLVVTSVLGPGPLGLYARAYQLVVQPANLIGSVADRVLFPALSRIQDDKPRMARAYVVVNSVIAMVTLPAGVLLCVLAPEIVTVLLGDRWSGVVLPLQILAAVLLPRTAYKISGSLTRATGAVLGGAWRQWLYAGAVVVGCSVGSRWGVVGVAVGASAAIVMHFAVMLKFSARIQRGLVVTVLATYAKSLPMAAATLAVSLPLALRMRGSNPDVVTLAVTGVVGALTAAAALFISRRMFGEELGLLLSARGGAAPKRAVAA